MARQREAPTIITVSNETKWTSKAIADTQNEPIATPVIIQYKSLFKEYYDVTFIYQYMYCNAMIFTRINSYNNNCLNMPNDRNSFMKKHWENT